MIHRTSNYIVSPSFFYLLCFFRCLLTLTSNLNLCEFHVHLDYSRGVYTGWGGLRSYTGRNVPFSSYIVQQQLSHTSGLLSVFEAMFYHSWLCHRFSSLGEVFIEQRNLFQLVANKCRTWSFAAVYYVRFALRDFLIKFATGSWRQVQPVMMLNFFWSDDAI